MKRSDSWLGWSIARRLGPVMFATVTINVNSPIWLRDSTSAANATATT